MLCKPPRGKPQSLWKKIRPLFLQHADLKTYVLSFSIWEKMVADNSKMASSITVFKNLQIFMQQIEYLNEK